MNERDEEVWQRRQRGEAFRHIGRVLGMAVSSVQRCYQRACERRQRSPLERLEAELAKYDGDGPYAEEIRTFEDCARLNELERYLLRFFPEDSRQRRLFWEWAETHPAEPPPEPIVFPINDGYSWPKGVDAALADGTEADDDW